MSQSLQSTDRPLNHSRAPGLVLGLVAAAVIIASATLFLSYRETDRLAEAGQVRTVSNAISQHGLGLLRELKNQSIWGEAYRKTAVDQDRSWMNDFYGSYLNTLLGYDAVYVLDAGNRPIYGFEDGRSDDGSAFAKNETAISDLLAAVRDAQAPKSKVVSTLVKLGDREVVHRAVNDVRLVAGQPVNVVVATIVPDAVPGESFDPTAPTPLLIATYKLDQAFLDQIGRQFDFADLRWASGSRSGMLTASVASANGSTVGTLSWRNELPGRALLKRIAGGFALALLLLVVLGVLSARALRAQTRAITESHRREAALARTDFLTGLPNRLLLSETLPGLIEESASGTTLLAVLSIDLDGFKDLNDGHGHHVGDEALRLVARRLSTLHRCLAVRNGGDEFVVIAKVRDRNEADQIADRVVKRLNAPMTLIEGLVTPLGASVGYAVGPIDGDNEEDLLRRADLALFRAKRKHRGNAVSFDAGMEMSILRRRTVEKALRRAILGPGIAVAYQPVLAEDGTTVVGVEALARWNDEDLGQISPAEFIPIAEESGLIVKLGEQVMRRALTDAMDWPEITVAVNVSATQIHQSDIVSTVVEILQETGFPPGRLEIELTESILVADEEKADLQIRALRALGVRVALDDFGTGYSSLLYLRRFGFDKLKIDRSFVQDSDSAFEAKTMITSIVGMSRSLGLTVTAEGVENSAQHAFLRSAGCDQLQGFLFSGPISAGDLSALVHSGRTAAA
jgi:diguanylate cyclase (GGDEF)-like protein